MWLPAGSTSMPIHTSWNLKGARSTLAPAATAAFTRGRDPIEL